MHTWLQASGSPLGRKARKMASSLALLGRKQSQPTPPLTVTVACEPPSYDLADTIAEPAKYATPPKSKIRLQSRAFPGMDEINETWSPGKLAWGAAGGDPNLMRGQVEPSAGVWAVAVPDEPGWVPAH